MPNLRVFLTLKTDKAIESLTQLIKSGKIFVKTEVQAQLGPPICARNVITR